MQESRVLIEDVPKLAADAFALAERLCGACRHLHSLWPYLRLSRASTGVEGGRSELEALLRRTFADHRRILIAGAADTGILALVARAGAAHELDITVLDPCRTPLELNRRLAADWSLPLSTLHSPLQQLEAKREFDLVLVHGTLHFIPPEHQQEVLARLARALRPNGLLVLLYNTSPPLSSALSAENRSTYPATVIQELERLGIALPEARDAFVARLDAHARTREGREGKFAAPAQVHALLHQAGFALETELSIAPSLAAPYQQFIDKMAKRRFLAVARLRRTEFSS